MSWLWILCVQHECACAVTCVAWFVVSWSFWSCICCSCNFLSCSCRSNRSCSCSWIRCWLWPLGQYLSELNKMQIIHKKKGHTFEPFSKYKELSSFKGELLWRVKVNSTHCGHRFCWDQSLSKLCINFIRTSFN